MVMGHPNNGTVSETTREIYELCCRPGARVKYRSLRLEKLDQNASKCRVWEVARDGEYVDTVNVAAFQSASQLQRWLDMVSDGDDIGAIHHCDSCPLHAVPGD